MAAPVHPLRPGSAAFTAAFGQRPVFSAGLAWGLGMVAGLTFGYWGLLPLAGAAGGLLGFCRKKRRLAVLCGLLAAFSCLYAALSLPPWRGQDREILASCQVTGVVEHVVLPGSRQMILSSLTAEGEPLEGKLQLWLPSGDDAVQKGAEVTAALSLRPAESASLYGCYALSREIRYTAATYGYTVQPGEPLRGMDAFRVKLAEALEKDFSPSSAGVLKALLLGDGSDLGADYDLYREMGAAHMLAVSGLHVSILLLLLAWLPSVMWEMKVVWAAPLVFLSNGLLLLLFGLLTGFRLSVSRAIWMWLFGWLLKGAVRPADPPMTLVLSFAALTALRPLNALDPGLWFSLLAVLGILSVLPFSARLPLRRVFFRNQLRGILAGCAAMLFVLPLTAAMFGLIQPLTPLTTLLLTPLLAVVIFAGMVYTAGVAAGLPWLTGLLAGPLDTLLRLMARGLETLTQWVQSVPLLLTRPWAAITALCLTPLWSPGFLRPPRRIRRIALGLATLLTVVAFLPLPAEIQGDRLLLTPVWNHTALLVSGDGGLYALTDTGGDPLVLAIQREAAGRPVTLVYLGEDTGELGELREALSARTRLAAVYMPEGRTFPAGVLPLPDAGMEMGGFSLSLRQYSRSAGTKLYTVAVLTRGGHSLAYGELFRLKEGDDSFADCCLYVHAATTAGRLRDAGSFPNTMQVWNGGGSPNLAETGSLLLEWGETGIRWYQP